MFVGIFSQNENFNQKAKAGYFFFLSQFPQVVVFLPVKTKRGG